MIKPTGALAAALLCAGAAQAQPPQGSEPTEAERRELEKSLAADQASTKEKPAAPQGPLAAAIQSLNPDLALILDVAGAAMNVAEPIEVEGLRRGFNLQELELFFGSTVDPYFRLDAALVFTTEGVEVEEAYATTLSFPLNLQLRAGAFLTRFGRLNPTHPHTWSFVDRPIVLSKILGEDGSRGPGLEVSWLTPLPWYAELVASGTAPLGECCAPSFLPQDELPDAIDTVGTFALRQFFPFGDDWSLLWGLSSQLGRNRAERLTTIAGTDVYLRWRPVASSDREAVSLQAEALYRSRSESGGQLEDGGFYAQLVWNLDPRWETGVRGEYVAGVSGNPLAPFWTSERSRFTGQLTFYPSHFSRVRLQVFADDPTWQDRPILGAFLALEVVAGAHGSHAY